MAFEDDSVFVGSSEKSGETAPIGREGTGDDMWVPTICYGCTEGTCLIRVHVVDGVAVNVEGNITGQDFKVLAKNQGRLCPKPYGFIQKLYNPHRIKTPLKRTNPEKGIGIDPKWVEISWDEALALVATKLKEVRAKGSRRLAIDEHAPSWRSLQGTIFAFKDAFGPREGLGVMSVRCDASEHIFGNIIHGGFQCEPDLAYCNYLILLGSNYAASGGVPENVQFAEARARGMKIVVVDPVLTVTAAKADEWIPIRPSTDAAFLLALINVIIRELGIYDTEFLKNMTNSPYLVGPDGYFVRDKISNKVLIWDPVEGEAKPYDDGSVKDFALEGTYNVEGSECRPAFQVLKDHVGQYTPEWASTITDIHADTVRRIAKEFVENARIGSTIKIGDTTLPYRPVGTKLGRGITGAMRSYPCTLANHILAALVGSLEVPGGHQGGRWQSVPGSRNLGITPGPDGMPKIDSWEFTWPPVSYDGIETLLPYSKIYGRMQHLAFLNLVNPPKGFPTPPALEAYIRYRTNPMLAIGEPKIISEALKRIPFIVSISYTEDEVTQFADIVLPEHIELERFELTNWVRSACAKKFWGIMLRQPVVEPLYNTMDISDIFTELAERIGILEEYNSAVNDNLGLVEPYKLEPGKKYAWVDIVDRHCKSLTKGAHDLQWFKENGAILRAPTVEEQYDVHLGMKTHKVRYPVPYLEHTKKIGDELAKNLARVGIDWWPVNEYVALPIYVPSVLEQVPSEYDFYVTTCRSMQFSWGNNVGIPLLIEIAEHVRGQGRILMNATAASDRGIRDSDEVWVESEVGKVKGKVKLSQGVRPDTIVITQQFGQWAMPVAKDMGWVSQTMLTPIRHEWTDPVIGVMQGIVVKAKVYKA